MMSLDTEWNWPNIRELRAKARSDDNEIEWPPERRGLIQRYIDNLYKTATETPTDDKMSHTKGTVDNYLKDYNWFEMWLRLNGMDIADVTPFDALDIGVHLSGVYAGSTAGTRYRNIRLLYDYLRKGRVVDDNPFKEWSISRDCGINENTSQQSRELSRHERYGPSPDEILEMVECAEPGYKTRDGLIVRMLYDTGCRVKELRGVRYEDIDGREIYLRPEICKYGKDRYVRISRATKVMLDEWTEKYRPNETYARYSTHVFPTDQSGKISSDSIEKAVKTAADRAGLNDEDGLWVDANEGTRAKISPHNLRYSCGYYRLFDADDRPKPDANIYHVSRYLGHSSVTVTERIYIEENPHLPPEITEGEDLMPE